MGGEGQQQQPTWFWYMPVGSAVAVPVERALDYSLGQAYLCKHEWSEDLLLVLPAKFSSPG